MVKSKTLVLSISLVFLLGMVLATAGCIDIDNDEDDEEPTTGTIRVIYHSTSRSDVRIYLNNESLGQIPSDEWITFEEIEPGEYTISATAIDDKVLNSTRITVREGETTRVEFKP